jgi:CTP synthase (UTP-ammonia lyase)
VNRTTRISLVGDYDADVLAHQAIPRAIELSARRIGATVNLDWLPTDSIHDLNILESYHGIWCVPASPYRSMEGALLTIRYARENNIPFLGTCGGFQHALIEYARNVLGWEDADHAETAPWAERAVITPLACSRVEQSETLRLVPTSRMAEWYGRLDPHEGYHCSFGVNPAFRNALLAANLREAATDGCGALRAVELEGHPFFVATLFQPERLALRDETPPIVAAFVRAAMDVRATL